jgi:hypothetical protein
MACCSFEKLTTGFSRPSNGGVDRATALLSSFAGSRLMRNTLPPLASNDLFADRLVVSGNVHRVEKVRRQRAFRVSVK